MVGPLSYFSFQPVLHDWCNKGRGMCYPVFGRRFNCAIVGGGGGGRRGGEGESLPILSAVFVL